jgi:hypothetical protein
MKTKNLFFTLDYEQIALQGEASCFRYLLLIEAEKRPAYKSAMKRIYKEKKNIALHYRQVATNKLAEKRQAEQNQVTA